MAEPERLSSARALGNEQLILNVASDRLPPGQPRSAKPSLELRLLSSEASRAHFGLEKVDRQLPVGLFNNTIAHSNRIFTGGKSAIDLVGVGGGAFWIFELKGGVCPCRRVVGVIVLCKRHPRLRWAVPPFPIPRAGTWSGNGGPII